MSKKPTLLFTQPDEADNRKDQLVLSIQDLKKHQADFAIELIWQDCRLTEILLYMPCKRLGLWTHLIKQHENIEILNNKLF